MIIPHSALSPEALRGVIEEYVTREGTEYGSRDYTLEEKVNHVIRQLDSGEVLVHYDPESGTCNLLTCQPGQQQSSADESPSD